MRLKFWLWAHRKSEALWHWIYYKRVVPLLPKEGPFCVTNVVYFEKDDVPK